MSNPGANQGMAQKGDSKYWGEPAFPLVNQNANLQAVMKAQVKDMLSHHRKDEDDEAESIAHSLLMWENLPCLFRIYAHNVLAKGVNNPVWHGRKAVEVAEWGIIEYPESKESMEKVLEEAKWVLSEAEKWQAEEGEDTDEEEEDEEEADDEAEEGDGDEQEGEDEGDEQRGEAGQKAEPDATSATAAVSSTTSVTAADALADI